MAPLPLPTAWGPIGWRPYPAVQAPWQQVGGYSAPFPTQVAGYWPDVQRFCGVEGIARGWSTYTPADVPYWQTSAYPVNPRRLMTDGRRPGQPLGPADISTLLGPQRQARAQQVQQTAAGLLGW